MKTSSICSIARWVVCDTTFVTVCLLSTSWPADPMVKQAKSLKNVTLPTLLPGISVTTSDKINMNYTQMRPQRWTGTRGTSVLDASSE
jgi:hypothetical protein